MKSPIPNSDELVQIRLLPFDFDRLVDERVCLVSMAGDWLFVSKSEFSTLSSKDHVQRSLAQRLVASHIARYDDNSNASYLLSLKVATRNRNIADGTGLHIFVVTLRCEHSCGYCQVSRKNSDSTEFDMSLIVAMQSLEIVFQSPSKNIKIEFQGGESLLNFDLIKKIVKEAKSKNAIEQRNLQFVIATNLAVLDDSILDFAKEENIYFSTSLDGPKELHNLNRNRPGQNSWELTIQGIQRVREKLGKDSISALMTTTEASLRDVTQIIDQYVDLNFHEIFLRPLSPYGFAMKGKGYRSYDQERWSRFYFEGLQYIIELNRNGIQLVEQMASLYLKKILTNDSGRYVDLMTPTGAGLGALVYNYDGSIYASDEGRMLKEMGDETFKIGKVGEVTYNEIMTGDTFLDMVEDSFAPSNPMCSDCAYKIFCGSDPVLHYALHGDFIGHKPSSSFCQRTLSIVPWLMQRYEEDPFCRNLFDKWAMS
jgi:uncharacterized protein